MPQLHARASIRVASGQFCFFIHDSINLNRAAKVRKKQQQATRNQPFIIQNIMKAPSVGTGIGSTKAPHRARANLRSMRFAPHSMPICGAEEPRRGDMPCVTTGERDTSLRPSARHHASCLGEGVHGHAGCPPCAEGAREEALPNACVSRKAVVTLKPETAARRRSRALHAMPRTGTTDRTRAAQADPPRTFSETHNTRTRT